MNCVSVNTIHKILLKDLGLSKFARWVPKLLTEDWDNTSVHTAVNTTSRSAPMPTIHLAFHQQNYFYFPM